MIAWTGLSLYAVWLAVALGLRAYLHWRATGHSGVYRLSGAVGTAAWWAGIAFLAALVLGMLAPLADLLGLLAPLRPLDVAALRWLAAAVAAVGIVATARAQAAMGSSWRVGVDPEHQRTELVTSGVFARVRNPIFSAMALTGLAIALVVPNLLSVVAVVALWLAIVLQVRQVEEPFLRQAHGAAYLRYCAGTPRFVPSLGARARVD